MSLWDFRKSFPVVMLECETGHQGKSSGEMEIIFSVSLIIKVSLEKRCELSNGSKLSWHSGVAVKCINKEVVETSLQGGLSSGVGGRGLGQVQAEPQEVQDRAGSSGPFPVVMPHISASHRSQVVQLSSARELSEKVHTGVLFIVFPGWGFM